jgi:hypothetical protein
MSFEQEQATGKAAAAPPSPQKADAAPPSPPKAAKP